MEQRQRTPLWLWINLLSLDAPFIALVWQDFLARCYSAELLPAGRWGLGLAVWAIYLADRLVDVRVSSPTVDAVPHRFYRQNYRLMGSLFLVALCADLLIVSVWLRHAIFTNGLVVSAGVITYFGVFPVRQIAARWKPLAAAVLFTAGVFVVAWAGTPNPQSTFGWPLAAFCLLCFANLALISCWAQGKQTLSTTAWILLLVVLCAALGSSPWYAAIAVSGLGLMVLSFAGRKLPLLARRLLADAVLLSPLFFLWKFVA